MLRTRESLSREMLAHAREVVQSPTDGELALEVQRRIAKGLSPSSEHLDQPDPRFSDKQAQAGAAQVRTAPSLPRPKKKGRPPKNRGPRGADNADSAAVGSRVRPCDLILGLLVRAVVCVRLLPADLRARMRTGRGSSSDEAAVCTCLSDLSTAESWHLTLRQVLDNLQKAEREARKGRHRDRGQAFDNLQEGLKAVRRLALGEDVPDEQELNIWSPDDIASPAAWSSLLPHLSLLLAINASEKCDSAPVSGVGDFGSRSAFKKAIEVEVGKMEDTFKGDGSAGAIAPQLDRATLRNLQLNKICTWLVVLALSREMLRIEAPAATLLESIRRAALGPSEGEEGEEGHGLGGVREREDAGVPPPPPAPVKGRPRSPSVDAEEGSANLSLGVKRPRIQDEQGPSNDELLWECENKVTSSANLLDSLYAVMQEEEEEEEEEKIESEYSDEVLTCSADDLLSRPPLTKLAQELPGTLTEPVQDAETPFARAPVAPFSGKDTSCVAAPRKTARNGSAVEVIYRNTNLESFAHPVHGRLVKSAEELHGCAIWLASSAEALDLQAPTQAEAMNVDGQQAHLGHASIRLGRGLRVPIDALSSVFLEVRGQGGLQAVSFVGLAEIAARPTQHTNLQGTSGSIRSADLLPSLLFLAEAIRASGSVPSVLLEAGCGSFGMGALGLLCGWEGILGFDLNNPHVLAEGGCKVSDLSELLGLEPPHLQLDLSADGADEATALRMMRDFALAAGSPGRWRVLALQVAVTCADPSGHLLALPALHDALTGEAPPFCEEKLRAALRVDSVLTFATSIPPSDKAAILALSESLWGCRGVFFVDSRIKSLHRIVRKVADELALDLFRRSGGGKSRLKDNQAQLDLLPPDVSSQLNGLLTCWRVARVARVAQIGSGSRFTGLLILRDAVHPEDEEERRPAPESAASEEEEGGGGSPVRDHAREDLVEAGTSSMWPTLRDRKTFHDLLRDTSFSQLERRLDLDPSVEKINASLFPNATLGGDSFPPIGFTSASVRVEAVQHGHGLVALRRIERGTLICTWSGSVWLSDPARVSPHARFFAYRLRDSEKYLRSEELRGVAVSRNLSSELKEQVGLAFMCNSSRGPDGKITGEANANIVDIGLKTLVRRVGVLRGVNPVLLKAELQKIPRETAALLPRAPVLVATRTILPGTEILWPYKLTL